MARNYPADISMQAAMQERFRKENDAQLSWFLKAKYGLEPGQAVKEPEGSRQMEVLRRRIELAPRVDKDTLLKLPSLEGEGGHSKKVRNYDDELYERVQKQLEDCQSGNEGATAVGLSNQPVMRPPSGRSKTMLYDGFSKEGKGRHQYLRTRYRIDPEVKFQYPLLSSMEYGWRLSDVIKKSEMKKTQFGRTRLIHDTFYTRTGIPLRADLGQLTRTKTMF